MRSLFLALVLVATGCPRNGGTPSGPTAEDACGGCPRGQSCNDCPTDPECPECDVCGEPVCE
jgi:hypothetical protein